MVQVSIDCTQATHRLSLQILNQVHDSDLRTITCAMQLIERLVKAGVQGATIDWPHAAVAALAALKTPDVSD